MAKPKIVVGETKFRSTLADGNPTWVVKKARGGNSYDCEVVEDMDWAGSTKVFGGEEILAALRADSSLNLMMSDHDKFWASLKPGQIIHYHNGFGCYVRGVVIAEDGENHMKATALVGSWRAYDLPKRAPDGEIVYPYHAESVVNGGTLQPNYTNVFESPAFYREAKNRIDPTDLKPFDLSVPEMTPVEKKIAELEKLRQRAQAALEERDVRKALKDVATILQQANRVMSATR